MSLRAVGATTVEYHNILCHHPFFQKQMMPQKSCTYALEIYVTYGVCGKTEVHSRIETIASHKKGQASLGKALGSLVSCSTTEKQQISPPFVYVVICFWIQWHDMTECHNRLPVSVRVMQVTDPKSFIIQTGVLRQVPAPLYFFAAVPNITLN